MYSVPLWEFFGTIAPLDDEAKATPQWNQKNASTFFAENETDALENEYVTWNCFLLLHFRRP